MSLDPIAVKQLSETDFPSRIANFAIGLQEAKREAQRKTEIHALPAEPSMKVVHKPRTSRTATKKAALR